MEERQDLQQSSLSPEVIRQGFSNQLKELTFLNEHSPRIFMVYTHSLYEQEETQSLIVKQIQGYLNPTLQAPCPSKNGHLNLNLYSGLAPQGNGADTYNEYKTADVLYRQMCLLPKHKYSADYVILCGSHFLQEYSEIKEVEEYTNSLRKMLSTELCKQKPSFNKLYTTAESALHTFKDRCKERNQRFHPVYTELAFLQLRSEEKYKDILPPHNLITLIIDKNSATSSFSFPYDLQDNSIDIGTAASLEKDAKGLYLAIFPLLSRLFGKPELDICRKAIRNVHHAFRENANLVWTAEEAEELAERQNNHEKKRISKQRASAKHSFFAPSSLSEEELLTEVLPRTVCKTTKTVIDTAEITEVLRTIYQQNYANLPRLFSEEVEAIADTFVNVAILKEEVVKAKEKELDTAQEKEEQPDTKEMQDNRLQSHERLYEVHETIAIGELFAPLFNTLSPKKLLLYGRAGIGKTVLCQYLANQWAEKPGREKSDNMACFRQFQAVFWIPLRELMDTLKDRRERGRLLKEEMIVAEMVTACCLKDSDWQEKKKKQQLQMWLKANAESTLFILDGYDEIAEVAATSCTLSDCLHAVLHQIQYKPYVMLTSRPVAIHTRYGSFDRRLECMGFIDENIPSFVKRYIKDAQQSKNCLTFLKGHPSIWGTAHIPLNLELLCWLWSSGELAADNSCCTMAALYSQITTKMKEMNVDAQKHPHLTARWQYTDNQPSETTLADFAEEFFPFLSFHAMQQPGVLLKGRDIKRWLGIFIKTKDPHQREGTVFEDKQRKLLQTCVDLSFLKSTQQGGKHLFDHTYYFIHLSFQEFFAAKYYQQAFERSDAEVIQHFRIHKYTLSYQLTWWMTAGLLYQQGNDLGLRAFFQALCTEPYDLIGIHHANLLSHCLDECQADEKVDIIAQLTQHLAGYLKYLLEKSWLIDAWDKAPLYCPNLLRAKSFQDIGLYFFEKPEQIRRISSKAITLLLHVATQKAIACLAHPTIDSDSREYLALALAKHSDLTLRQIQSLIACLTNTMMDNWSRRKFARALASHPHLTPEHIQSLFACLTNTTIDVWARIYLAEALTKRPDLTPEHIQSLIICLTNTTMDDEVRRSLAPALAQHPNLTPEHIQSLFACLTYMKRDARGCRNLAKALAQRLDLTPAQIQSLITLLTIDMTGDVWGHNKYLAQTLASHPSLTSEHLQSLFACLTADITKGGWSYIYLAQTLALHPDLTPEQIQSLFACLTDTAMDDWGHRKLTQALIQRPNLTPKQIQSLFTFLTNTSMNDTVRRNLAQALAQRPNLTPEQIQSLFTSLTNTSMDDKICRNLASYPGLTLVQIQSLIACFTNISMGNTSMGNKVYRIFASRLTSRPDLTPEHIQSLLALLKNTTINVWVHIYLASALAKRPNLTPKQIQSLIACLINTSRIKYIMSHRFFSTALAKHPDLTPEHIQSLFVLLKNTTIWVRGYLASALANRTDLTLEQIQSLFACLTDTAIDIWDRRSLALALAQHSSFNAKQLRQLLIYCLQEEIICEEYPSLIFSILQTYYSISTIEQQKIKVFPGLNAFLTRFSTWYALAEHEALFLYDEATGIALLRLSTQTIEIPLHLHPNPFLILSYEAWGGDLHPMETEEIFEQQAENYSPLLK